MSSRRASGPAPQPGRRSAQEVREHLRLAEIRIDRVPSEAFPNWKRA